MPIVEHNGEQFHLSHEEEEKLTQFQTITNFEEDSVGDVIKLLINHGWNVEPALGRYFDGTWKDSLIHSLPRIPERPPTPVPNEESIAPFLSGRHVNLVPSLPIVHALPNNLKSKYSVVGINGGLQASYKHNPVFIVLMFLPKLILALGSNILSVLYTIVTFGFRSSLDNQPKVYRIPSKPSFDNNSLVVDMLPQFIEDKGKVDTIKGVVHKGSFNDALKICRDDYKYLLVILVGDILTMNLDGQDLNSARFLSKVLANQDVIDCLASHKEDLIIYLGSVTDLEPWLVSKEFQLKYTPESFIIGNVLNANGSINGITRPSILSKMRIKTAKRFINSLNMTFERYNPELIVSRREKQELELARKIKQSQNEAYEESLRKDQLKQQEKQKKLDEDAHQEELRLAKERDLKLRATCRHLKWLEQSYRMLSDINAVAKTEEAILNIRTSNGTRLVKKFPSTTSLHEIYMVIGCHLYLDIYTTGKEEWENSIADKIKTLCSNEEVLCFQDSQVDSMDSAQCLDLLQKELHKWKQDISKYEDAGEDEFMFELVSPFPRYCVPVDKALPVKEVSQLWPKGSLLVEMRDMSTDEDSDGTDV